MGAYECVCNEVGWLELYVCTVNDRIALVLSCQKHHIYTVYIYGSGQP